MTHLDARLTRRGFLCASAAAAAMLSPLGRYLAQAASPTYLLPYPGGLVWQCVQGANSGGSHSGRAAWAWDFRMPQGSPVMAARDGVVSMLKQDSYQSCPQNIYSCPDWNNYIVIDHGDGSSAAYLHGFQNGARVRLGQQVRQGDVIGISGTTGQSGGPHLHFQVQHTTPGLYIAQSFAIGFVEVAEPGRIPVRRGSYRSANAGAPDFDIRNGHFYSQTNGTGSPGRGFAVSDEGDVPMWSTLVGGGGVATIGYPLSRRFQLNTSVYQVFQRQVLEWNQSLKRMRAFNIAELPTGPIDPVTWLPQQAAISVNPDLAESDHAWDVYAAARLASLEAEPRIKAAYFSVDDPIRHFGLPTSLVTEAPNGSSLGLRTAYANFQIAKRDSGFAKAGDLTISNSGDLILDAEPFSRRVFEPEPLFPDQPMGMVIPAA